MSLRNVQALTPTIRMLDIAERGAFLDAVWRAFGWPPRDPEVDEALGAALEPERTLVATEDGEIIGTAGAYSLRMTVPGGALRSFAAVTMVSVAPTHRRRGVLTMLMHQQLEELGQGGEATAALWASEPAIYQRFGFGLGAWRQSLSVDVAHAAYGPRGQALVESFQGRLRRVTWPADAGLLQRVLTHTVATRPGLLERPRRHWNRLMRAGGEIVLAEGPDGEPLGYSVHRVTDGVDGFSPAGTVTVLEVTAPSPVTLAVLWRQLLDTDLVSTLKATNRPLPEPLAHLLVDHRRMRGTVGDSLWVRVVDLPRALAERAFAAPLDLVLEVEDTLLPGNTGRWRVAVPVAGAAAVTSRTEAPPDLTLDIADLGAAHLGGITLAELSLAGRVLERTPGALTAASTAWSWSPTPWCPEIF